MAKATGTMQTFDITGIAEDIEDVIYTISPTETPLLTMAKRKKITGTYHQWQTDALAAVAANRAIEGDDSTYATVGTTTLLGNYAQISKKSVIVSGTADAVKKYGRAEELARLVAKQGKELKRDIEYALVTNQASSAGGAATARSSAGIESMIAGNRVLGTGNTTGTTPGYAAGVWAAPTDGTATAMTEGDLVSALEAAWQDGGDPSVVMVNSTLKRKIATFGGASKFSGVQVNGSRSAQAVVIGGVDLYISDFGEHKIVLNRYMRTGTLLAIDPGYVSVGFLRPIKLEERAKTGDAERAEMLAEYTLILDNPDAHAKIQSVS